MTGAFRAVLLVLGLGLVTSACATRDDPPASYPKVSYDYLTKLRLNVASVDIDDSLPPNPDPRDVSNRAPTPPVEALRQMAQDRLVASGASGHAVFVIDDASIVQNRDRYEGRMTVHLDVTSGDGSSSGYAEARVARSASFDKDTPNATRAALNALVTQMMADMNVEFEYQVRRSLRAYLQARPTTAPLPPPVQSEDLAPPPPTPPSPFAPSLTSQPAAQPAPAPLRPQSPVTLP
jgi:hypothetical protein